MELYPASGLQPEILHRRPFRRPLRPAAAAAPDRLSVPQYRGGDHPQIYPRHGPVADEDIPVVFRPRTQQNGHRRALVRPLGTSGGRRHDRRRRFLQARASRRPRQAGRRLRKTTRRRAESRHVHLPAPARRRHVGVVRGAVRIPRTDRRRIALPHRGDMPEHPRPQDLRRRAQPATRRGRATV